MALLGFTMWLPTAFVLFTIVKFISGRPFIISPSLLSERLCNHKASQCESHRFFLERSRNSLKYLTIWWTFVKKIHEKKTNKKRYLGAVHKWRHHFWRVYTPHYGLTGRPIKNAKVPKKVRNGAQKSGMMTRNLEHQFFLSVIENYIRYSALQCHLAAAFCFIINVAWFIFSDLSSDAWAFSCVYTKRYIIYGQNSQSQEFQQNNLLKSCIGSLVESENCNRTASPPDLAHCAPPLHGKCHLKFPFWLLAPLPNWLWGH